MDISNLLSLPTDSLYKFVSMLGALLLFSSSTIPFIFKKKLTFQEYELERDIELIQLTINNHEQSLKKLNPEEVKKDPNSKYSESKEWNDELEKINSNMFLVFLDIEKLKCERKKLTYVKGSLKLVNSLSAIGFMVGLVLFFFGIVLWYTKLQIFLDIAVKK